MWRTLVFAFAGTVGFLVDAGVLQLLVSVFGAPVYGARVVSFLTAVTATWLINRRFTFREQEPGPPRLSEWLRYLGSSLVGGATNYGAFALAIAGSPYIRAHLIIGVAIGSLAGMVVNYLLYSKFVFKRAKPAG
jgi:putative flippase GtrA